MLCIGRRGNDSEAVSTDLEPVDTHDGEQKRGGRERDHLAVDDKFTGDGTEHPLAERDEQYLCRHRDEADHQVADREIQKKHAHALVTQRRLTGDHCDERNVTDQRQ